MSKQFDCTECGEPAFVTGAGITHHGEPGDIDYDADGAHVALQPGAESHSPETWTVDDGCIKGPQADMYPILFERVHATEADMRLAAAAPALAAALRVFTTEGYSVPAVRAAAALLDSLT